MQAAASNNMSMDYASSPPSNTNNAYMTEKDAAQAWATCLAEAKDSNKYPRVPVIDGPFNDFKAMLVAKYQGNFDPINTSQRPTGPTRNEVKLLQGLYRQGMPIDQIAAFLVVTFPNLMAGWKTGSEYDRRLQIHGLVSIWNSMWAPQVMEDGSLVQKEDIDEVEFEHEHERFQSKGRKEPQKMGLPKWWTEAHGTGGAGGNGAGRSPLIRF